MWAIFGELLKCLSLIVKLVLFWFGLGLGLPVVSVSTQNNAKLKSGF